ncbi:MAG: MOSC domain-containing protein, partial [Anaerolineales bacterium]
RASRGSRAMITVSDLYYYPIKSCRGYALQTAVLDARGISHDRRFLIVDAKGRFITQREQPRVALIEPCVTDDSLSLTAPGMSPLMIETRAARERRSVVIWRDTVEALDMGEAVSRWLSEYLREPARLVKFADDVTRKVSADYARRPTDQTGFADGYPLLLITQESLDDLNTRLAVSGSDPLPMNRFRPNLVVSGAQPYAEDSWQQIRIGDLVLDLVKPCARCVTTTTDQHTAARGKEPLATLARYRNNERGALFGQNVIHAGPGTLHMGDAVEIVN